MLYSLGHVPLTCTPVFKYHNMSVVPLFRDIDLFTYNYVRESV